MNWVILAGAVAAELVATLSLKASRGFTKRVWILPVVAGYGAAFTALGVLMGRGMSVGVVYGIWVAAGVALIAIAGRILFGEPLTKMSLLGIGLIAAGVILVETGG